VEILCAGRNVWASNSEDSIALTEEKIFSWQFSESLSMKVIYVLLFLFSEEPGNAILANILSVL
jgi:hypothetical protein